MPLNRIAIGITFLAFTANILAAAKLPIGSKTYGDADGCQTFASGDYKTDSFIYLDATHVYGWEKSCSYDNIIDMQNDKWVAKLHCQGDGSDFKITAAIKKDGNKITFTAIENEKTQELFVCLPSGARQDSRYGTRRQKDAGSGAGADIEDANEDRSDSDLGNGNIIEVQTLLYDLGFAISVDGALGPETSTAIRSFQEAAKLPQTGQVSRELANALRAVPPPTNWGAIAYTANGQYISAWQIASRREAESLVQQRLKRRTSEKIAVQSVSGSGCATIVSYRTRRQYGIYSQNGNGIDAAEEAVLAACKRHVRTRCQVVTTICADGRHK